MMKVLSIFVDFLENMNFNWKKLLFIESTLQVWKCEKNERITCYVAGSTMEFCNVTEISKLRNILNAAFLAPKCLVKT